MSDFYPSLGAFAHLKVAHHAKTYRCEDCGCERNYQNRRLVRDAVRGRLVVCRRCAGERKVA